MSTWQSERGRLVVEVSSIQIGVFQAEVKDIKRVFDPQIRAQFVLVAGMLYVPLVGLQGIGVVENQACLILSRCFRKPPLLLNRYPRSPFFSSELLSK